MGIVSSELAFRCDKFKVYKIEKQNHDGKGYTDWDIVYNDSVVVLSVTKDRQAVLVKEHVDYSDKNVMQLPGGGTKDGESVEEAALRELGEETGYTGDRPVLLMKLSQSTRKLKHDVYYFAVTNARKSIEQKFDADEIINEVVLMDFDELLSMAQNGTLETTGDAEAVEEFNKRGL